MLSEVGSSKGRSYAVEASHTRRHPAQARTGVPPRTKGQAGSAAERRQNAAHGASRGWAGEELTKPRRGERETPVNSNLRCYTRPVHPSPGPRTLIRGKAAAKAA